MSSAADDTAGYCYKSSEYGRYYHWDDKVLSSVCPDGWHVPDTTEWNTLIDYAGGPAKAWVRLRTKDSWSTGVIDDPLEYDPGSNDYGFSAYPAGYRYTSGYVYNNGVEAAFWTTTASKTSGIAYAMEMYYTMQKTEVVTRETAMGYSIRCIKD